MEKEFHEQYEYARNRIKQKKRLYYHFVFFMLVSIFLIIASYFNSGLNIHWCIWGITLWAFFFVLHFIKVFITDRFMDKNWERDQIERLVALQQKKIAQLQSKIEETKSE